jgi:hypothetical protein
MPLELFLRIAGCPPRLAHESSDTLARLQSLAIKGTLLGDMDSEASRAVMGDASSAQMREVFKETETKLSRLIRLLHTMRLIDRSDVSAVEAGAGGARSFHHRLARSGSFQPSPDAASPGERVTCRVDSLEGHAQFWDGLERAFKGKHCGPLYRGTAPVDMTGAFPNCEMKTILNASSYGLCAHRMWSRVRDMNIEQRIMLLQRLADLRMETNKIRELSARGDGIEGGGSGDGGGGYGATSSLEAEARAAARASALQQTPLSHSQIMKITRDLGLRKEQVVLFYEQSCKKLLNDLIADGTITVEEAEAAERDRNARKVKRKRDDLEGDGGPKRRQKRRLGGGSTGKGNGKRLRVAGAEAGAGAGAGAGGEEEDGGGGGGGGYLEASNEDLEAVRAEIGERLSKESTHTAVYRRMQRLAAGAADADADDTAGAANTAASAAVDAAAAAANAAADAADDLDEEEAEEARARGEAPARGAVQPWRFGSKGVGSRGGAGTRFKWTAAADHRVTRNPGTYTPTLPCAPYTLHPTPYTPIPYTLHPTPYTLHLTPYTLHPTPYVPTPYTL